MECHPQHNISRFHIFDLTYHLYANLDHLAKIMFARFLNFPWCLGNKLLHSPCLRSKELCSIYLRGEYLHEVFKINLYRFIFSLFIQLFICIYMDMTYEYLFCTLYCNPSTVFYFGHAIWLVES